jgi:bisphosphoglycerate-independent phosphoglycerate mutase (AlkP superfamily)
LKTLDDLQNGQALSADFTAQGWRDRLDLPETPVLTPIQAGERMAALVEDYDLAFFEYWLSDYAGHNQDMQAAHNLLAILDQVLGGLLDNWNDHEGMILITSDHGNMEDLSTRRHTANPVPALLVGDQKLRSDFATELTDLTGVAAAVMRLIRQENL